MSKGPASGIPAKGPGRGPARGYSWPAFEPGHRLSVGNRGPMSHGAYSPRRVDPLAAEILETVQADVSWWRPADLPVAWKWAQAEARVQLLSEYLMEQTGPAGGLLDEDGEVLAAAKFLVKCESIAANLASRLGLDPLSRARLGRDVAAGTVDFAKLMAELGEEDEEDQQR